MSSDLLKPVKAHLQKIVPKLEAAGETITVKKLRAGLEEAGWKCSDEEWKEEAKDYVSKIGSEFMKGSSSPAKQSAPMEEIKKQAKATKNKYDRAAEKNLGTFMKSVAGPGDEEDDDESDDEDFQGGDDEDISGSGSDSDSDEEGSGSGSGSASASEEEAPKKKTAAKKKKAGEFKSSERVGSDDDSEAESGEEEEKGTKGKKAAKPKKEKVVKEKKLPPPKEGDAPRGSEDEEKSIAKMKSLLSAAGTKRPFTPSTGPERTLSVSERIKILEGLLKDAGLKPSSSMSKAKEVGERRELEKEAQELSGVPIFEGLRGGKKRLNVESEEEDDDEEDGSEDGEPKKKKKSVAPPPKKKFGAFLGDQSSDSD